MPYIPTTSVLTANSIGIINTIIDNTPELGGIPHANETSESLRMTGEAICAYQPRMNAFINALVNRIGMVVITSKMYNNPWAAYKKGMLNFGETIEEIFVDISDAYPFNPSTSQQYLFKRMFPNVKSAFHAVNLKTFYPVTISEQELRFAFTSINGVYDLIGKITNAIYTAANYDEFIMMKYAIAMRALEGTVPTRTISEITDSASANAAVKAVKKITGKFKFMSQEYNIAGVNNFCESDNLYCIMTTDASADIDVDSLAKAYNLKYVDFVGRQGLVDSFAFNSGEIKRLDMLLADDPTYKTINAGDNETLSTIGILVIDKDFIQVYDVLNQFTEQYNSAGLSWNYFYHVWRVYSTSPFANAVIFTTATPAVTAVTVNGPEAGTAGETYQFTASVSTTNFANKGVIWSIAPTNNVSIDQFGRVTFNEGATGAYTVKAVSAVNATKSGTKKITIS